MRRETLMKAALFLLVLALVSGLLVTVTSFVKRNVDPMVPTGTGDSYLIRNRSLDGVDYRLYSGMHFVLLLGIDKPGYATEENVFLSGGQADAIFVAAIDEVKKDIHLLQIDRDTICSVRQYGVFGDDLGFNDEQIALAYAYGNGGEASAKNMIDSVSRLLGIKIDDYMALNMGGVRYLASLVGNVTVTLDSDSEWLGDGLKAGMQVEITPDNAETFIRARMETEEGTNRARMARHRLLLEALLEELGTGKHDLSASFLNEYDHLSRYLNSSLSKEEISSILSIWPYFNIGEIITPVGETDYSGEYVRFYVDSEALNRQMIQFCFVKK